MALLRFFYFKNYICDSIKNPYFCQLKPSSMRKQRTREHVIEDLGFNYVERQILYAGFTVERYASNNGDGHIGIFATFNDLGEIETHLVEFQLKSKETIPFSEKKKSFIFDLSKQDLEAWLLDTNKMLLILYDAQNEVAYFEDLQVFFKNNKLNFTKRGKFVRIFIPMTNLLTPQAIHNIRLSLK
jgi:hypothetical protein